MWLSKTLALRQTADRDSAGADMGVTTIGGGSASVMTRGELRELEVFAPGGVVWQPRAGDTVLVMKGGPGGQERCVVAAETAFAAPEGMAPGELYLYSAGGASIYLRRDGAIAVQGPVTLKGNLQVTGNISLVGQVSISGSLVVNGAPYSPAT